MEGILRNSGEKKASLTGIEGREIGDVNRGRWPLLLENRKIGKIGDENRKIGRRKSRTDGTFSVVLSEVLTQAIQSTAFKFLT
jgi:hypothetical protein